MFKKAEIFYIHTITPMHVGSGSDLGIVDMPIQRESHTSYPKIEGSSLKGSIREAFEQEKNIDELKIHQVFGYDETNASEEAKKKFDELKDKYAGALGFSDARILLFPIKSVKGVFAYVTCPNVIKRYENDLVKIIGKNVDFKIPNENTITQNSKIKLDDEDIVILEEYSFEVSEDNNTNKLAEFLAKKTEISEIKEKLIVLSDDDFKDFVNMFTEVITRTKIDNKTGTVKDGALFNEEYLPSETVMYSMVFASSIIPYIGNDIKNEDDVMKFFKNNCPEVIQIGGNATIGKGICKIIKGGKDEQKNN